MTTPSNTPADSADDEIRLLHRLRDTPQIFAQIAEFNGTELKRQQQLRATFDDELVRAALALHEVRIRAGGQLPLAESLWLTRTSLEQSTSLPVAQHKARRFAGCERVFDCCSGIGVDATAIAAHCPVTAIDLDSAMTVRCEWNTGIWQPRHSVTTQTADVIQQQWHDKLVHADPDRRAGRSQPTKRLEFYQPDLSWMQALTETARGGAIKISPAANFIQKFNDCEIELISLNGECREATIWFGELAGESPYRATVLPTGESVSADPLSAWVPLASTTGTWFFDPDPAVVRSGMLDVVAEQLQLERLDPEEEYLTGNVLPVSGFVTAFHVEQVFARNLKDVRKFLAAAPSSHYEVKCRRIPTDARAVQKQLPTGSHPPRVLIFARIAGKASIVVCRRVSQSIPVDEPLQ